MMFECKCFRNLVGFAVSRPPCVIFTVCLATFAVGLFSLGYYVQTHDIRSQPPSKIKEWSSFVEHFNAKYFCASENASFHSTENQSNSANSSRLIHLNIPVVLTLYPSEIFRGVHQNISHVTTVVQPYELGLKGVPKSHLVNITLSLYDLWSLDCPHKKKCEVAAFETCGSLLLPAKIVPHDMPQHVCNTSSVQNTAFLQSSPKPSGGKEACAGGVAVRITIPRPVEPPVSDNPISMVDSSTVNLRLQYSGYFLFVLVISSILYGMIKGKPVKQMQKKAAIDLTRQF